MALPARRPARRLLVGLAPLALALAALPLLAPTCGGGEEGTKTFARNSLVIPMDRCYQSQTDGVSPTSQPSTCPQGVDAGDVIKAYGLVYQLIRNDVAVYWVINGGKTTADAEDFNIQYNSGFPAFLYDWSTGQPGAQATSQNVIRYRGGPFVVDGSDYARASSILQQYKSTFQGVNVHVSNVAFSAYVKKTMAGGWSAGGTVPPKLALLDIGSGNLTRISPPAISDPKNAEPVISGYLARAGIGSGAAAGTATGPHGEIYDKLGIADFQPAAGSSDWHTSRFGQNGYQILWVPHWLAPGSCSNYSSSSNCAASLYPTAQTDQVLATIGAFVAGGGDVFAECAGLGSFEGTFTRVSTQDSTTYTTDYQDGDPATRFQSTTGMRYSINGSEVSYNTPIRVPDPANYASPLLQLGDFTFKPVSGAIDVFRPNLTAGGAYQPGVVRLVAASAPNDTWDFFTLRPAAGSRGTIVYLGGHSYSGVQGSFQIGGSRLVLNTLFNLGAGCTESGVSCDTGLLGVCGQGRLTCSGAPPQPTCAPVNTPSAEICNGLDDDCNGLVDDLPTTDCYDGPPATRGVGLCRAGVQQCVKNPDGSYGLSVCQGQVLPGSEVCNALDDDCDGVVDEGLTQSCYFGPIETIDPETGVPRGACRAGTQTCTEGNFGPCTGQVLPQPEVCVEIGGQPVDEDCDGIIDEGCTCTNGQTRPCYSGPVGTAGVGLCRAGVQTCAGAQWGACVGEVLPAVELCNDGIDQACNGMLDDGPPACSTCQAGQTLPCYGGPAGTQDVGLCRGGTRSCVNGAFSGVCEGDVTPATGEPCDGLDNDCNGLVDDGAVCATGYACERGVCVPSTCGTEQPCPEGYDCLAGQGCKQASGACGESQSGAGDGVTCAPGKACRFGACVDPCEGVLCGEGAVCASGACVGGSCYFTGCPDGELCLDGTCRADPCTGLSCPSGTFCRQGDCVQACTFVSCRAGERCGIDGFCEPDSCAGKTCAPLGGQSQVCVDGQCVPDTCAGLGCGQGQVCREGICVDDPCAGVKCPAGACLGGQCYPLGNPGGLGSGEPGNPDVGGCGCGAGGGVGPVGALLALLAVPLARRRRRSGGAALAVLAAALLAATACKQDPTPFDPAKCGGATVCENVLYCVDLATDASNCGACAQSCGEGNQCVDGACGPTRAVAPRITSISPVAVPNGGAAPVTVEVNGERFAQGAQVRAVTPGGTILLTPATLTASKATVTLDLEDAPENTWQLRVVNPDRVISNTVPLDVYLPAPVLSAVTPSQVFAGAVTELTATGAGLGATSQCFIVSATVTEQGLPSAQVDPPTTPPSLSCTLDAGLLNPGSYQIFVRNPRPPATPLDSGKLPFTIVSPLPTLAALSPSAAESGTIVAITLTGTGFDVASKVRFDGSDQVTTYIDATRLYVDQLVVPPCGSSSCNHAVVVRSGQGVDSNALTFRAGAAPPQVLGVSPGTGYQGEVVLVVFTGSGFPAGSVVQAAEPAGAFVSLPSTMVGTTEVRGTLDLAGRPEGSWLVRILYPDATTSSTFPFRVLSNQAILRDAVPRGAAQGGSVPVTLTVGNLRPPLGSVRVLFGGQTLTPSPVPSGTTVNVTLNLAGKDTGGYSLQVLNPSASPSNALSFNVTPGAPTLSTVNPTSAARSDTPVTVTLTGVNFARPDAGGTGGSSVHISATDLGVADYTVPSADTTVVSPTQIQVRLDTRNGVPGAYDVSVWNPGGPTPPQKSNVLNDAFNILP
jgi:hypothetical protein